jgi:hypothetical protein
MLSSGLFPTICILNANVGMKMEQTECSETLAFKIQMPGNNPEESIQRYEIRW